VRKSIWILLFLLLSSFSTCGKRGEPLPPRIFEPAPPEKADYQQNILNPLIFWNPPKKFIDGEIISQKEKLTYILDINFGKEKIKTERNFFLDKEKKPGEKVCYRIAAVYNDNIGEFSEPVCFTVEKPILKVPKIKNKFSGDGFVKVIFKNPPYPIEVFKTEEEAKFKTISPYKTIIDSEFIDKNVKNGQKYLYKFRFAKKKLKGNFSPIIIVKPEDKIPPKPPKNPTAIKITDKEIFLIWEPSSSEDVEKYIILLNGKPIGETKNLYFQTENKKCIFTIEAIDKNGNRSNPIKIPRR